MTNNIGITSDEAIAISTGKKIIKKETVLQCIVEEIRLAARHKWRCVTITNRYGQITESDVIALIQSGFEVKKYLETRFGNNHRRIILYIEISW